MEKWAAEVRLLGFAGSSMFGMLLLAPSSSSSTISCSSSWSKNVSSSRLEREALGLVATRGPCPASCFSWWGFSCLGISGVFWPHEIDC